MNNRLLSFDMNDYYYLKTQVTKGFYHIYQSINNLIEIIIIYNTKKFLRLNNKFLLTPS